MPCNDSHDVFALCQYHATCYLHYYLPLLRVTALSWHIKPHTTDAQVTAGNKLLQMETLAPDMAYTCFTCAVHVYMHYSNSPWVAKMEVVVPFRFQHSILAPSISL